MKKIKITCKTDELVSIDTLEQFQGDLKMIEPEEMEKLKSSIKKYGFSFPVFVWGNYILDGHQRVIAAKELIAERYECESLPVVEIEAKDRKEAAEKLLLINSRYAKIDQSGFDLFVENFEIDVADMSGLLEIPEVELNFVDDDEIEDIIEKEGLEYKINIDCDSEVHQIELMEKLEEMGLKCRPLIL